MIPFPMNSDQENEYRTKRHSRIRLLKKILRPLPRKATIHRYPILRHFSDTARKRFFLWSFKQEYVIRAIYAGCILSLMPIYGLQIIAAFIFSLLLRANLMVMVALQFITNPITAVPLYILCFKVGGFFIDPLYDNPPEINIAEFLQKQDEGQPHMSDMVAEVLEQSQADDDTATVAQKVVYAMTAISVGGIVIGGILGVILSIIYRWVARQAATPYKWLQEQRIARKEERRKDKNEETQ